jgi:cytochrome b
VPSVRVWDPLVRSAHWTLVLGVLLSWLTREGFGALHEWLGYAVLAIVAVRLLWGFVGPREARFASFVVAPGNTLRYARALLDGREQRYLGHNPLGGWMIVALLTVVTLSCVSGWLYTTDRYWGVAWVETLHARLVDVLIVLVVLHVAGVLQASWRHRENLIAAMIHGRKRAGDRVAD